MSSRRIELFNIVFSQCTQILRYITKLFPENFRSIWFSSWNFRNFWKFNSVWRRFPFDQKFHNFRNGDKWYEDFLGKVLENPEIVEFPESEPFNRKFPKFQDENQMERKFPGKSFRKFGYTSQGRVVRKPVNANPGLKVNRSIDFSCIKMFFASYFLFSLRLFKFEREDQTI